MENAANRNGPRVRGNGQGTVFKMPNGKWRAEVTLGWDETTNEEGEVIKKKRIVKTKSGFKRKKDAIDALPSLYETPIGADQSITFKEMYKRWSNIHYGKITKDTEYCYTAAFAKCEKLYYKQFAQLKAQDYQAVVDECPQGRRTKQNIKAMLTCMYDFAMQNDYCDKNYAQYISLPAKTASKKDAFTKEERDLLWKKYDNGDEFVGYMLLMIYTGMRYGEISTILKENVHLDEKYLTGGIKTEAGKNRMIPLCDKIVPVITRLKETPGEKILDMAEKKFYTTFAVKLEDAGVRNLPPHCCRHTCATALAEAGVAPAIIQAILGHTDYATTMQYTHVQRLPDLLSGINKFE